MRDEWSHSLGLQPTLGSGFGELERFELCARLGEGAFGVVYEVLDRERKEHLALKALRDLSADGLLRFKKEFRALQDLEHPNLVRLEELFEAGGQWFFTMELVRGIDLLSHVRHGPLRAAPVTGEDQTIKDVARATGGPAGGPVPFDEAKLRACLIQLAQGLGALHAAGMVHRDVKPGNVLVTPAGRLVLLDFGLVTEAIRSDSWSNDHLVGTVAYMAPEQAAAKPVGAPADWYSVGVVLYEALTGELPFTGPALTVLLDKQQREVVPPQVRVPGLPEDLCRLCQDLLEFDPAARPSGPEVLRRLGVPLASPDPRSSSTSLSQAGTFVGREAELTALRRAYAEAKAEAVVVLVHGDSGVGKSTLVQRFTEELTREDDTTVVLVGHCYHRELLPYKAFDSIVDRLSRYLACRDVAFVAGLLPLQAALLGQAFPVLRHVAPIAQAPRAREAVDPRQLRVQTFSAMRELLLRLAEVHRVVLVIDDLQWADGDSLALLRELVRPPDSPRLLILATVRATADTEVGVPGLEGNVRLLGLGGLEPAEAQELVARWLAKLVTGRTVDPEEVAAIVAEAEGHPLFVSELVRHLLLDGERMTPHPKLEEALGARIRQLDPPARELLQLLALAEAPLSLDTAARAAGLSLGDLARVVSALRVAHLARATGMRKGDLLEPYHSRVRDAVLAQPDPGERRAQHERLAMALEAAERPDDELLAIHWRGAGQPERAALHAVEAAAASSRAMAFDHAAGLLRLALDLHAWSAAEKRRLEVDLGDALANAGRGAEAAQAYGAALAGAPAAEVIVLRRRKAEELMRAGYLDEGVQALGDVLAEVGLRLARTPRRALLSLLLRRAMVRLRGLGHRLRDARQITPSDLSRIDTCFTCSTTLGLTDLVRGADFQARGLLYALRAGEPFRVARALMAEAGYAAVPGGRETRSARLLAAGRTIAEQLEHPYLLGLAAGTEGLIANCKGQWRTARPQVERAEEVFRTQCTGVTWELDTAQLHHLWSLYYLGEVREFARRRSQVLEEARQRGDCYLATGAQVGQMNQVALFRHDPATARLELEEAMRRWSVRGFHLQHVSELLAQLRLDLYEGDGPGAHQRLLARWPALQRSLLTRFQWVRIQAWEYRAATAIAAAAQAHSGRKELLGLAERDAARLERERMAWSTPLAYLLQGAARAASGDAGGAAAQLARAVEGFEAADMALYAAVARRRLGQAQGGDEGHALIADADAFMTGQGILRPDRITAMLAPGAEN